MKKTTPFESAFIISLILIFAGGTLFFSYLSYKLYTNPDPLKIDRNISSPLPQTEEEQASQFTLLLTTVF